MAVPRRMTVRFAAGPTASGLSDLGNALSLDVPDQTDMVLDVQVRDRGARFSQFPPNLLSGPQLAERDRQS